MASWARVWEGSPVETMGHAVGKFRSLRRGRGRNRTVARLLSQCRAPELREEPMGRNQRDMEGDNRQRRAAARDARADGRKPSEVGATLGASKQLKSAKGGQSHQERTDQKREGKPSAGTSGKPRPGSREVDPKRTNRWT